MSAPVRQLASITHATAVRLVADAVAAAEASGQRSAVAVVDVTGYLVAFTRMDGAPVQAVQLAQDKAYTAAGYGLPTGKWQEFMQDDAPLALGAAAMDRLVPFGGGLPITVDGQVAGGIGVSGGHWSQDAQLAEAAIASLV